MKALKHLHTITAHKLLVMKYCFAAGLYWQGITHDLSKYSPTEFLVGAKYYQGNRSPNNAEREARGYSSAWLHHKGRNKHHLEYWIDYVPKKEKILGGMKMPAKYVVEMFCDRIAACRTYQKENYTDASPWKYYQKSKKFNIVHPRVEILLEDLLKCLAKHGEAYALSYAAHVVREDRRNRQKAWIQRFKCWSRSHCPLHK